MCAAPGSKTAQLIEAIHAEEGDVPPGNCEAFIRIFVFEEKE